jgi:elongation factor G
VLVTSASNLVGVDTLLEFIVDYGPNPLERTLPPLESGEMSAASSPMGRSLLTSSRRSPTPSWGEFLTLPHLHRDRSRRTRTSRLARGGKVRLHSLFKLHGKEHRDVADLPVGGIGAVAKIDALKAGDTLRSPGAGVVVRPVEYPRPVTEIAITPRSHQDEEKLSTALSRIAEEDPTVRIERRPETGETILAGLGDTHVEVTLERIQRMFGVEIDWTLPTVPYRETITASAAAEGKHKKQTGGRGQFGVASRPLLPAPTRLRVRIRRLDQRGARSRGLSSPQSTRGSRRPSDRGILAGYPVIDVSAEVYDGKYHSVDSDEMSFRMAGIQAFRAAPTSCVRCFSNR